MVENIKSETVENLMKDEEISRLAQNTIQNPESLNPADLRERAEQLLQTSQGRKLLKTLQKKGVTRKKMMKEMKESKKNKQKDEVAKNYIDCILINESRKVKIQKMDRDNFVKECKEKLKFNNPEHYQCENLSIGPLENKNVTFWIDSDKECQKNGNKKIKKYTGLNNSGSIIFVVEDEDFKLEDFNQVDRLFLENRNIDILSDII